MPFPFTANIAIPMGPCHADDLERVMYQVESALRAEKPTRLERTGQSITFGGGPFRFVPGHNRLVATGSGKIDFIVTEGRLTIDCGLSYVQLFVAVTLLVALVFGLAGSAVGGGKGFCLVAWLWLFGGNCLISRYRFPRFIKAAAEKAMQNSVPVIGAER